ncbi:MAG TPA: Uma2 family endonuclease [Gammaproteobacteria bacterium]|nr:Uma2 family endonuclease [Gammaproteobacteria bacterium]
MGNTAAKVATYEDLLQVPDNLVAEIIHGQLHTHPRPAPKHARASSSLGMEVGSPYDKGRGGPGGWWILDEPELHLDANVLVPDLAGWKRERMPELPETAWFELPPDWVCEILSPSTARLDRAEKMPLYAHHGVSHLWLVDPDLKTLEAYELKAGQWLLLVTLDNDKPVSVKPFDEIEFPLSALWA